MYVLLRRSHHEGNTAQPWSAGVTHARYHNAIPTRSSHNAPRSEDARKTRENIQRESENLLRECLINAKAAEVYAKHARHLPIEHVERKEMATHSQTPHVKSSKNRRKSCMRTLYRAQNATGSRHHRHQSVDKDAIKSSLSSTMEPEPRTQQSGGRQAEPPASVGAVQTDRQPDMKEITSETDAPPSAGGETPHDSHNEAEIIRSAIVDAITEASGSKPGWANHKSTESISAPNSFPSTSIAQRNQRRNVETSSDGADESVEAMLESIKRSLSKRAICCSARRAARRRTSATLTSGASVVLTSHIASSRDCRNECNITGKLEQQGLIEEELCTYKRVAVLGLGREGRIRVRELECSKWLCNAYILKLCRTLSLQRPKKKPLHEYYNDDDAELEGKTIFAACSKFHL